MPCLLLLLCLALLVGTNRAALVSEATLDADVDEYAVDPGNNFGEYPVGHPQGGDNRVIVTPFKLPYLAPGQVITSARVTWNLRGREGSPQVPVDVYGLARASTTGEPLLGDFYIGPNDAGNTRLMAGFVTPSTVPGPVTLSNPALLAWIQKQVTGVRTVGDHYVFLRLNGSDHEDQHGPDATYLFSSSDCARPEGPTLTLTVSGTPAAAPDRLQFSFSLPRDEVTSAGIYRGPKLLRTLWNNVPATSGPNFGAWDGLDDQGAPVGSGDCQVRVLTHNVGYTWEGVIGNTSRDNTGTHVWRSFGEPLDLDIAGTTAYYAVGYNEGQCLFNAFSTADPQVTNQIYNNEDGHNDPFSDIHLVAADDHMSWWVKGRGGMGGTATYVVALDSDHHLHTFPEGDKAPEGQKYKSCLDLDTSVVGDDKQPHQATGIAVQKNGRFIFLAHDTLNVVRVFDKMTGAKVGTIDLPSAGRCACDPAGNLYVISRGRILKVTVDAAGHAEPPQELVRGLTAPLALACDPATNAVAVVDDGHVRAFDRTTGVVLWTYGHRQVVPKVEPDAFIFREQAALAFQPDGSFWLGDSANSRLCHYAVHQGKVTFLEQVIYQSVQYMCAVDQTQPSHCFCGYAEFVQDFTKPLAGTNGSWSLVNNWVAGLPNDPQHHYYGGYDGIQNAMTLSNGRRYALIDNTATHLYDLFELPPTGVARRTGISMDTGTGRYRMSPDGSLRHARPDNNRLTLFAQQLRGFDAHANPGWGPPVLLASAPIQEPDPIPDQIGLGIRVEVTPSRVIPVFGPSPTTAVFYHFGTIPLGGSNWLNLAMPDYPDNRKHKGKLPRDGHFDSGNGVQYAGNVLTAFGRNCFVGYNGEFWKNGQAATDYHFLDDGLMVGSFGVPSQFVPLNHALAGFAGNNFTQELAYDPGTKTLHLWCDDESNHGGLSRWRINNLESIVEITAAGRVGQVVEVK